MEPAAGIRLLDDSDWSEDPEGLKIISEKTLQVILKDRSAILKNGEFVWRLQNLKSFEDFSRFNAREAKYVSLESSPKDLYIKNPWRLSP